MTRLDIYETRSRFYVITSEARGIDKYTLLKIDRLEPRKLVLSQSGHHYTRNEINEMLHMIHGGNQEAKAEVASSLPKTLFSQKSTDGALKILKSGKQLKVSGLSEKIHGAYGLLGFVRFLESYYIIVVTKASKVAQIGYDGLYQIDDVSMLEIDSNSNGNSSSEQRYLKLFQSVDLSTNFYFSYSYDLTHTLQENQNPHKSATICEKFVWNRYLMEPCLEQGIQGSWLLPVIHGYVGQTHVQLPAIRLSLLLIARRSNKYAGTRFLKRGANLEGQVANEVETEQIVCEVSGHNKYTGFVQHRGSIPLLWSQDPANRPPAIMGKPPPITLDLREPFGQIPALHFRQLKEKYGDPIVAVNLCKRRERRPHESLLNEEYRRSISYLNQFLSPEEYLLYVSFDMARCNKLGNVLPKLEEIAYHVLAYQGWYQSFPPLYAHCVRRSPLAEGIDLRPARADGNFVGGTVQRGIARTNCVDCLDRTNTAQFVLGKVALAHQLFAMGLLPQPAIPLQADICQVLETLYEEHGDTLALQYAGSHLVHSVKTYKKTAAFTERSRDVIQTLSRYYSNTFADYDKQNAINLFLGVYRPLISASPNLPLWDLPSDLHLHNASGRPSVDYCDWMEDEEENPKVPQPIQVPISYRRDIDKYWVYYRCWEYSQLESVIARHNAAKQVPLDHVTAETSGQPFLKLWKRQTDTNPMQQQSGKDKHKGDGKQGGGDSSSEEEEAPSDTEVRYEIQWNHAEDDIKNGKTMGPPTMRASGLSSSGRSTKEFKFSNVFPTPKQVYGMELLPPSKNDMIKYETYGAYTELQGVRKPLAPVSLFTTDSTFGCALPAVSESSLQMYRNAVRIAQNNTTILPTSNDVTTYVNYCKTLRGQKLVDPPILMTQQSMSNRQHFSQRRLTVGSK